MASEGRLTDVARAIYDALFTAAPIDFDEAKKRGCLMYQRAMDAAARVQASVTTDLV